MGCGRLLELEQVANGLLAEPVHEPIAVSPRAVDRVVGPVWRAIALISRLYGPAAEPV